MENAAGTASIEEIFNKVLAVDWINLTKNLSVQQLNWAGWNIPFEIPPLK